jgi:hypothetical protein
LGGDEREQRLRKLGIPSGDPPAKQAVKPWSFPPPEVQHFFVRKIFRKGVYFSWRPQSLVVSLAPSPNIVWLLTSDSLGIHRQFTSCWRGASTPPPSPILAP